jgi:hypothetical protein
VIQRALCHTNAQEEGEVEMLTSGTLTRLLYEDNSAWELLFMIQMMPKMVAKMRVMHDMSPKLLMVTKVVETGLMYLQQHHEQIVLGEGGPPICFLQYFPSTSFTLKSAQHFFHDPRTTPSVRKVIRRREKG